MVYNALQIPYPTFMGIYILYRYKISFTPYNKQTISRSRHLSSYRVDANRVIAQKNDIYSKRAFLVRVQMGR